MDSTLLKPIMMPPSQRPKIALSPLSSLDTSLYATSPVPSPYGARYQLPSEPPTEVIPRLYLSDIVAAENPSTLRSLGITHILSAMPGAVAIPHNLPIHKLQIPLQDNPFAELAEYLPPATAFIVDALRDPRARVLVHCVQGISRSTSVVCAYLIAQYGWTPAQAVQYIKSKRSLVDPNPGFISQLGEYAASLQRGAQYAASSAAAGSSGRNRAMHEADGSSRRAKNR